jgi:hypothetical protein
MAKLRADIRREVATALGDTRMIVQTTDAGSLSAFTDNRRLNEENGYYAGADIVITSGPEANMNEVRYVLDSERNTATLTIVPNWNEIPELGTTAELYNIHGMGATVHEWNSFINQAINEAATLSARIPTTVALGTFTADSWLDTDWENLSGRQQSVSIPSGIEYAGPVSYVKDGRTYYPERAGLYSGEGWRIDDVTRRVIIEGNLADDANGAAFFLRGFGPPEELHSDQDATDVPIAWLYAKVKALAYGRMHEKGLFEHRGESTKWEGIAKDAQRVLNYGTFPPNTVKLWS